MVNGCAMRVNGISMRLPGAGAPRTLAVAGAMLTCCAVLLAPAPAQQLLAPQPIEAGIGFPPPRPVQFAPIVVVQDTVVLPEIADVATVLRNSAQPISLPAALRLSMTTNIDIAQAREYVNQAGIGLSRARMQFLPTFNIGSAYTHHEGTVAKTEGNIIFANKDSLFVGGGPSLTMSFSDAIFQPLLARQVAASTQAGMARVNLQTLLAVADAYFNILRVRRRLARIEETLDYLTSQKTSPGRAGSKGLLPVVQSVQAAGGAEATRAEVERVRVEVLRRQEEKAAALQDFRVAMAELARIVRLDPRIPLWPVEDFRFPLPLPGELWSATPLEELVRTALNSRPELAENQALIRAAVLRVRTAQFRPLLPNVVLNYNWGDFGGGPDMNPPTITPATATSPARTVAGVGFGPSGRILHMDTRTDFDVSVVWKLQNLGFGDIANVRTQRSQLRQTENTMVQLQDRIIAQVVQANELVQGSRQRVQVTRESLFDKNGLPNGPVFQALRLNFDRIRTVPTARPLEVLDSIRGMSDTLDAYGQAVTDYERARYRLLIVLGMPPLQLLDFPPPPQPPQPLPPPANK
jgi:outer membrane protein TolC